MSFVNLHNHFNYSVLDGAIKVDEGVRAVVEMGQPAISMTDHGTIGGAYQLWKSATAAGIKPIIGCEFYVAPHDRTLKEPVFWGTPEQRGDDVSSRGQYLHLTVIARDASGLRSLFRLQHEGYASGFYSKPRIDLDALDQHSRGITVLTGCPSGHLQTAIRLGQRERAEGWLSSLKDIFGEHLWLEVMDHGLEIESRVRSDLAFLGGRFGLRMVATADAHYATPADQDTHDNLLCVQMRQLKGNQDRFKFTGEYHLASAQEMTDLFGPYPVRNTLEIAESVESYDDLFQRRIRLPKFSNNEAADLESLVLDRVAGHEDPRYDIRATYELEVINGAGYPGYFLTLMEAKRIGVSRGIRFGPGRGSVGGSLVAYLIGLTDIDPIEHGCLFERFLNPERVSLPDIDTDVDDSKRDEFLGLLRDRYGEAFVANVATYGIIGARSALKDATRILGYPVKVGTSLVGLLPPAKFGRQPSLTELPAKASPKEIVAAARGMEGGIRTSGTHASAVIISPDNLLDLLPTKIPKSKPQLTVELTGEELDELGFIKYDFLGLAMLGVIDECLSLLPGAAGLPKTFDDSATFELFSRGDTTGVFQMDGLGMRTLLRKVRPESLGDLAAVLALYRPGPMGANSHHEFADRKNGRAPIEYPHPEFESSLADILSPTYGLIVFQEQVLLTLSRVGGYTYATAGLIFDAMRKKDTEKMLKAKPEFERRLAENGYSQAATTALWETLVPFSDYSFNKAHSIGYGMVSYWSGWLKANYPREFYCALLSREDDPDKLKEYILSAVSDRIPLLPPDINESKYGWSVGKDGILFGLGAVRGISRATYDHIDAGRPYLSMDEWWQRAHAKVLNLSVLSAAIRCGAFDQLESNREQLYANADSLAARALHDRKLAAKGQKPIFKSHMVSPGNPKLALRQSWEEEVLGIALTKRAIRIKMRRSIASEEWEYLKALCDQYAGYQPVDIVIGPLTTLKEVARISLTPKALQAIQLLPVDVEEDE